MTVGAVDRDPAAPATPGAVATSPYRTIASDLVIYAGGGLLVKSASFFIVPVLTRAFSVGGFGIIEVLLAVQAAVVTLAGLNLDGALARYFYEYEGGNHRRAFVSTLLSVVLASGAVGGLLIAAMSGLLSRWLFGTPDYRLAVLAAGVAIPAATVSALGLSVFRFDRRPGEYAAISLVGTILQLGFMLVAVRRYPPTVVNVMFAQALAQIAIMALVLVRNHRYLARGVDWPVLRRSFAFALPQLPSVLITWYLGSANRFFLLSLSTLGAVASFAAASKLGLLLMAGVQAFTLAWKPTAMALMREPNAERVYVRMMHVTISILSLATIVIAVLARPFLAHYAGAAYASASTTASILVLAIAIAQGFGLFLGLGLEIAERTVHISVAQVVTFVVNTVLNLWLIPLFGHEGAALAVLGGSIAQVLALTVLCNRYYRLAYARLVWLAPGVAAAVIALVHVLGVG